MIHRSSFPKWLSILLIAASALFILIGISISFFNPRSIQQPTPNLMAPAITDTNTPEPAPAATSVLVGSPLPTTRQEFFPTHYPAVTFRKGPYLTFTGDNSQMEVIWQVEETTLSTIEWGTTEQYQNGSATTSEYTMDHLHRYIISDLSPGTKYHYRVIVGDGEAGGTFYARPDSTATDLKFFVYGDTRDGTMIHDQITGAIRSAYTADPAFQTFILATGDLVDDGDLDWMWDRQLFAPLFPDLRTAFADLAFLPVMGNHDGDGTLFMKYFPMPFVDYRYWSFDYGPAHIVMLDQYTPYKEGTDQYKWLENDLKANNKNWKFIVMHMPGWSASENNLGVQGSIISLAEQNGVSAVFAGHNHYYARAEVNGVTHITAGGGGAPLYAPNPNAPNVVTTKMAHGFVEISIQGDLLNGIAYDIDGNTIDRFLINR